MKRAALILLIAVGILPAPFAAEAQRPAKVPRIGLGLSETKVAARSLGLTLQALEVRGPDDFDGAFAAMARERAEALIVLADLLFSHHAKRLADLAAKHRLPTTYFSKEFVEAGGPHVLFAELFRPVPARRHLYGQDPERRETR